MMSTILLQSGIQADYTPPEIRYDYGGMPFVYYGEHIGYEINPLTSSRALISYYTNFTKTGDAKDFQHLKTIANWIVGNAVRHGNYATLEYEFSYKYNMTKPWRSAMAQAFAMEGLLDAYHATNNYTYFDMTKLFLNSFYVEVKDGGVTEKTDDQGWWYELYADQGGDNPKVLNGMLFTTLELYGYYTNTRDSKAKFLFDQGVLALKNDLASYDGNGYSYYDSLKTIAFPFYHQLHIDLLDKLYHITSEPIFKKFRDKWKSYQQGPANLQSASKNFTNYMQLESHYLTTSDIVQDFKNPVWVKNNVKWWTAGQINDLEFMQGIQYLIEKGITYVDTTNAVNQIGLETDQNTFEINRNGITVVSISGTIANYKNGSSVILQIAKPERVYNLAILADDNGEFTTQLLLDKNSLTGPYIIEIKYNGTRIGAAIFSLVKSYDW